MKTITQLDQMDERELKHEVLCLQKVLGDLQVDEFKSSVCHRYHFASNELLRLNRDRYLGSAVIISIADLKGELLIKPVSFKDGLSNESINALLDDLQYSYDSVIELTPTIKRL